MMTNFRSNLLAKVLQILFLLLGDYVFSQNIIKAVIKIDHMGDMYVSQKLNSQISDTILYNPRVDLFGKKAKKISNIVKLFNNHYNQFIVNDSTINYVFSSVKNKYDDYTITKDLFYTSINYIGIKKNIINKKKIFKLDFSLPKNFELVYPTNSDLEKPFNRVPFIIAGKFRKTDINDFEVYYNPKDSAHVNRINEVIGFVNQSFEFYNKWENIKLVKPKIVFFPFGTNLAGRTSEYLMMLDTGLLTDEKLNKRLIAHEAAHYWWGIDCAKFKNLVYGEAIAEFMAMQLLKDFKDVDYLQELLKKKNYNCEGSVKMNKGIDINQNKYFLSYTLYPLVFYYQQQNNPNFINKIIDFKKEHIEQQEIEIQQLNDYLEKFKLEKIVDRYDFSDLSIEKNNDKNEVLIKFTGNIDKLIVVPIEITDIQGKKSIEYLNFSKEKLVFNKSVENIKKILIDPTFNILQLTCLNDVWVNNSESCFSKNKYLDFEKIDARVIKISTMLIDFLINKNEAILASINDNIEVNKSELIKIKKDLNYAGSSKIYGATTSYNEVNKNIELKILSVSRVLVFNVSVNEMINSIYKVNYKSSFMNDKENP